MRGERGYGRWDLMLTEIMLLSLKVDSFYCRYLYLYVFLSTIQKLINNSRAQQPFTSAKIRHVLVF